MQHTENMTAEVRVLTVCREEGTPGSRFGPVIRNCYIIECCTGGRGTISINGKVFPVTAGTCYILQPGDSIIYTSSDQPREGLWCALDGVAVGVQLQKLGITSQKPQAPKEHFEDIRRWMEQLLYEWRCQDAGATLRQISCVYGLLGAMLQSRPAEKKSTAVDRAIGFMSSNYPDQLDIAMVAKQVGLERTYFSELFKEKTGMSPYQYLAQLRMQKARQILEQGYSVAETAYLVGMEARSFGRAFKNEVGYSPREYQSRLKRVKSGMAAGTNYGKK